MSKFSPLEREKTGWRKTFTSGGISLLLTPAMMTGNKATLSLWKAASFFNYSVFLDKTTPRARFLAKDSWSCPELDILNQKLANPKGKKKKKEKRKFCSVFSLKNWKPFCLSPASVHWQLAEGLFCSVRRCRSQVHRHNTDSCRGEFPWRLWEQLSQICTPHPVVQSHRMHIKILLGSKNDSSGH